MIAMLKSAMSRLSNMQQSAITWKQCKIEGKLVLITNRKSQLSFRLVPKSECLRGESPPDRMLATPWRHLCLAAIGLSLVVAVLCDSRVIGCCPAWQCRH